MKINFAHFIHALSDTIDLVGVDEIQHGKRVASMAEMCCQTMGESEERTTFLFRAGLLHDCGVSSTKVHKNLVNELEWKESGKHCQIGAERMSEFAPLADFAEIIRYHHTRWEDLKNEPIPDHVKRDANLIYLLDRVDALAAMQTGPNRLMFKDLLCKKVNELRGKYFESRLVDLFLETAQREAFWIRQEPLQLTEYMRTSNNMTDEICLGGAQLIEMATLFAQIVDAKSRYTAEHSSGVARLSAYLAKCCSLTEATLARIRVAALLHDLGKLQVPDAILDFDGGLEGESLAIMRHHSYVTHTILGKIEGLEEIAGWAANHHEKLDGSGYPFRRSGEELTIESRIIMVADIFQALAQNRPYRSSMPVEKILPILTNQVEHGKLDKEVVRIIGTEPETCYRMAIHQTESL